jgi:acetyl-CoA acetyltransferase
MAGAAFLLDAVRTPFGRYGGALGGVRPVRTTGSSHSPVEAARRALKRAGIGREDLTYVELNEAFAAQSRACLAEWPDLDPERVNALGGAIAIGHPLGASGTRVLGSLVHGLVAAGGGWGLAAICIGVGQGLAVVVEA